jgi:hypothetical protein
MAFSFDVNQVHTVYNGGDDWYAFLLAAIAKGWTVIATGDGLAAYGAGSNIFTSGGEGALGMSNPRAHFTIQQPAGGAAPHAGSRQICVQLGTGFGANQRYDARIVFSDGGTANLASADPDQVPSFSDENILHGGGTPAAPTFTSFSTTGTGTRNIVFGGSAENFSFYMFLMQTAQLPGYMFFFDGCANLIAGDLTPFVVGVPTGPTSGPLNTAGGASAVFTGDAAVKAVTIVGSPGQLRENATTGNVTTTQAIFGRTNAVAAPGGYKGVSKLFRWTTASKVARDTLSVSAPGAKDRIVLGDLTTVWDGSVPS